MKLYYLVHLYTMDNIRDCEALRLEDVYGKIKNKN